MAVMYDQHARELARFLRRRLGAEAVDDAVADVFERAMRRHPSYVDQMGTPLPWLYGIAAHVVADRRRSEKRHLRALERLVFDASTTHAVEQHPPHPDIDPHLVGALRRLKPDDRDTLLLLVWGELTYEEAAVALDVPVGTVRSRAHRAREQLKRSVAGHAAPNTSLKGKSYGVR